LRKYIHFCRGEPAYKKFNAQVKNKIGKAQAQIAQEKIKSVKRKQKLRNFFSKI